MDYWPYAEGRSAVNAFGTQLRDLINSGHSMAVNGIFVDTVAESERNPVSKC